MKKEIFFVNIGIDEKKIPFRETVFGTPAFVSMS